MNLLMVDDDILFLEKLQETISFQELGIDMVFSAGNIRQAIRILEEYPVEIILSDIEMPQGSGLELLQWIRSRELSIECIFLSSYAYFAYAQKAIALKSSDYLLKPVSNRELEKALEDAVGRIQNERGGKIEEKSERWTYWNQLLKDEMYVEEEAREYFFVLVQCLEAAGENDRKYMKYCLEHLAEDEDAAILAEATVFLQENNFFIIYPVNEGLTSDNSWTQTAKNELEKKTGCKFLFYIARGTPKEGIFIKNELLELARLSVLDYTGILWLNNWKRRSNEFKDAPWDVWENGMVRTDSILTTKSAILNFLEESFQRLQITKDWLKHFRRSLMQMIYNCLKRQNVIVGSIFGDEEFDYGYEMSIKSLKDIKEFVIYLADKLYGYHSQDNRQESVVKQIQDYISLHIKEDLSRKKLASRVYLSEDYLSKVFTSVTGISLVAYITSVRMEKAKEYLEYTANTVSQTAIEVGYTNFSYFSKNFRDYTGYTPNEFRELKRTSHGN